MIKADNITKVFGKNEVLKGISTTVGKGEVVTIIGLPDLENQPFCAVLIYWKSQPLDKFI